MGSQKRPQKRILTCIVCPIGCTINVQVKGSEVIGIEGNTCARGKEYARDEAVAPKRTVTTSVLVTGGQMPLASVRTTGPVPKARIKAVMDAVRKKVIKAPVAVGDIVVKDVAGTGADVIATRSVARAK